MASFLQTGKAFRHRHLKRGLGVIIIVFFSSFFEALLYACGLASVGEAAIEKTRAFVVCYQAKLEKEIRDTDISGYRIRTVDSGLLLSGSIRNITTSRALRLSAHSNVAHLHILLGNTSRVAFEISLFDAETYSAGSPCARNKILSNGQQKSPCKT